MYNCKSLSKSQLVELVVIIESNLLTAVSEAEAAGRNYSEDIQSALAFECGYLRGSIKESLYTIEAYKNL